MLGGNNQHWNYHKKIGKLVNKRLHWFVMQSSSLCIWSHESVGFLGQTASSSLEDSRAATNDYFHDQLICRLLSRWRKLEVLSIQCVKNAHHQRQIFCFLFVFKWTECQKQPFTCLLLYYLLLLSLLSSFYAATVKATKSYDIKCVSIHLFSCAFSIRE